MKSPFDTVIIGSGLIGSTAAIALAQKTSGEIALLDAGTTRAQTGAIENSLDTRTLALNYASVSYLNSLALWEDLVKHACPIQQVHISEQGAFGSCLLDAAEVHEKYLGQVVEIKYLQAVLLTALKKYPNITVCPETTVLEVKKNATRWELLTQHQKETQKILAGNLVLADGTHSKLREKLAIPCDKVNDQLVAIVAVAQCYQPHQNIAYERFAGDHVLAILPLTQQRVGTVLVVPANEVQYFLALNDQHYLQHLSLLLGHRLGLFTALGPRQHYPIQEQIAQQFVHDHLVLLGNTAHTLNPMGAQGLNLGLAGVQDYVQTIHQHHSLADFEMRQRIRCERLKKFTRETTKIFSSAAFPTRIARQTALLTLQHCDRLKQQFMRKMMGVAF